MNYKIIATTKTSTPPPFRARASKQELLKALAETTTQTIQEFQTTPIQILRANFILLSAMHEKSTNPKEKEQLNKLMAKAITMRSEGDPIPTLLRGTIISPIWIPESEAEKESVANFMAHQMTAMNKAAFIAFAQPNILEQTLQAASDKKVPAPQQELDIKTLYNKVNFTIVSQILSHLTSESRLETFRLFENIMNKHLREGDFASAFQIYTALTHSSVQRLSMVKTYVVSDIATGYKQAEAVFNPTKNFSALNEEMKKHNTYIPMIPQWFGHLETARIISQQHGAQPLDQTILFGPLILQQEQLRDPSKLSPCTENIQGLFSNVLHVIQDTDISPEDVMNQTSDALTKLSHAMENPVKPLLLKKPSEAQIDFDCTRLKMLMTGTKAGSTHTQASDAAPATTQKLMTRTTSTVLNDIWRNNPLPQDWDETSEMS